MASTNSWEKEISDEWYSDHRRVLSDEFDLESEFPNSCYLKKYERST